MSPVNDTAAASVAIYSLYLHLVLLKLAMLKTFKKKYLSRLIDFISDRNENGALVVRVGFAEATPGLSTMYVSLLHPWLVPPA